MNKVALKLAGVMLLMIGISGMVSAAPAVPEIDAASGANALALFAGALLVIRGRRRK